MAKKGTLEGLAERVSELESELTQIRKREKVYASLVESIGDSIYLVDQEGRYLFVNKHHALRLGCSPEGIIGKHYGDLHTPEQTEDFMKKVQEVFAGGVTIHDEYQEKGDMYFLRTFSPIRETIANDMITAVEITATDITERRLMEEALKQNEERYRTIVENIADGYYEVDLKGNILACNESAYRILGYSRQEFLGMNFVSFVREEDVKSLFAAFNKVFVTGVPIKDLEFETYTKSGKKKSTAITCALIRDARGKTCGFRGIFRDLTELKESESLFRIIAQNSQIGIYALQQGKFRYVNKKFQEFTGYTADELIGADPDMLIHPDDRALVRKMTISMLNDESLNPYEFRRINKNGEIAWNVESVWQIRHRGEESIMASCMDITRQKKDEVALKQGEERYRTIIENMEEGYYETDLAGRLTFFNESLIKMIAYPKDDFLGSVIWQLTDPDHSQKIREAFEMILSSGVPGSSIEGAVDNKYGARRNVELSASIIRDGIGDPIGFRGIIRDVTERKQFEEAVTHMAYYDALTGLPNRRLFYDRLNLAMAHVNRHKQRIAVMMLDLDGFKSVNDSMGHAMGDVLLAELARRLLAILRKGDTIARMGGDEFMLLLPEITSSRDARIIAKKLIMAIREPFFLNNRKIVVTTSVGIALYPLHGRDVDSLIRCADAAMYQAKKAGKDRYNIFTRLKHLATTPSGISLPDGPD